MAIINRDLIVVGLFLLAVATVASGQRTTPPCVIFKCLIDPCVAHPDCPAFPNARCVANYCNGCNAYYYVNGRRVNCTLTEPPPIGECPYPSGIGPCIEACNNCEARGQLCCFNGCGHQCTNPVVFCDPVLVCPRLNSSQVGICIEECTDDADCNVGDVCCSNGCGHTCQRGVDQGDNINDFPIQYACPQLPPGTVGICIEGCQSDNDCPTGANGVQQKCCSNGCGVICMDPVLPTKSGSCPRIPPYGPCFRRCAVDVHCPDEQLCCDTGCGMICKQPV